MSHPETLPSSPALTVFAEHYARLRHQRRRVTTIGVALFALCFFTATWVGQFDLSRVAAGLPRIFEYIEKILPQLRAESLRDDMAYWFYGLPAWLELLLETVLMAYTATLLGTLGALALCFYAAQNLTPGGWVYFLARRTLEIARTIPDIVYALIFVFAFGLGPLAGILAIAIHSMGASGKLFAEAAENIDMKPVDGLRGVGANWLQTMRYAVIPQVLPNFASYTLWRFELNVRTAAVMGFVGAGGIGQELITAVRMLYYEDVSALLLLIVLTVTCIDLLCERIRHGFIGKENLA